MITFKKVALLIFTLGFYFVYPAKGQALKYGLKAGINASDFSVRTNAFGEELTNFWRPLVVSQVGGFIENPMNRTFGIQAEILYSINGSNLQIGKSYAHFLSIPLILDACVWKHFILEVGPQASFIHKSRKSILLIDSKFDFAVVGGVKVNIVNTFDIGVRYVQGLVPLGQLTAVDQQGRPKNIHDFYCRNLQLSVAYRFSKKQISE